VDEIFTSSIRKNYHLVIDRIAQAACKAGRPPESVRLVVVTKRHPVSTIMAAVQAGAVCMGENYAEEAVAKMEAFEELRAIEWHMIGHIQSRKAGLVAAHFNLVHSLDSVRLAERLDRHAFELGKVLPVLLEFNLGAEENKSGWIVGEEKPGESLLLDLSQVVNLRYLRIEGLMTMPPLSDDPESARPYFIRLRKLQSELLARFPQVSWQELSMGTSTDFVVAITEGATLVRIGSAILGPRPQEC
jgi:pyridoxal phosphate enzyme (YggS family)